MRSGDEIAPLGELGPHLARRILAGLRAPPAAAYWLMLDGFDVSWLCRSAIAVATFVGDSVQPIRQPVIA